jgi:hypothetical protein
MALAATSSSNAALAAADALIVGGSGAGIVCCVAAAILASARWSRERVSRLRSAALVVAALFGVLLLVPVFHWHAFKPEQYDQARTMTDDD